MGSLRVRLSPNRRPLGQENDIAAGPPLSPQQSSLHISCLYVCGWSSFLRKIHSGTPPSREERDMDEDEREEEELEWAVIPLDATLGGQGWSPVVALRMIWAHSRWRLLQKARASWCEGSRRMQLERHSATDAICRLSMCSTVECTPC